jgi:hypothetical protein
MVSRLFTVYFTFNFTNISLKLDTIYFLNNIFKVQLATFNFRVLLLWCPGDVNSTPTKFAYVCIWHLQ